MLIILNELSVYSVQFIDFILHISDFLFLFYSPLLYFPCIMIQIYLRQCLFLKIYHFPFWGDSSCVWFLWGFFSFDAVTLQSFTPSFWFPRVFRCIFDPNDRFYLTFSQDHQWFQCSNFNMTWASLSVIGFQWKAR